MDKPVKKLLIPRLATWGWVVLYLAGWVFIAQVLVFSIYLAVDDSITSDYISDSITGTAILAAALLTTFLFCRYIHRERFRVTGLASLRKEWRTLLRGMAYGSIGLLFCFLLTWVAGFFKVGLDEIPEGLAFTCVAILFMAAAEEIVFRGYILRRLARFYNRYIAIILSALLFSLAHGFNDELTVWALINIFLAGLLLGASYIYTRSLWFPFGFHFAWNFLQGPILGYAVSGKHFESLIWQYRDPLAATLITGGDFGFESTILCTLSLVLLIVWIHFRYGLFGAYADDDGWIV